jgi:hypothetical protein
MLSHLLFSCFRTRHVLHAGSPRIGGQNVTPNAARISPSGNTGMESIDESIRHLGTNNLFHDFVLKTNKKVQKCQINTVNAGTTLVQQFKWRTTILTHRLRLSSRKVTPLTKNKL